ncbi:MAG: serine/threonine protein kinase, partial [Proteobacteria bacterium]|nr:serine/threonine protein kinase [Pseudomonadota bacterium]
YSPFTAYLPLIHRCFIISMCAWRFSFKPLRITIMSADLEQFYALKGVSPAQIKLQKHIASGGISDLWLATHESVDAPFVVKYARTPNTPYIYGQFEREYECFQVLKKQGLTHFVTSIFAFDVDGEDHSYLIEEYFPSESLESYMKHCTSWAQVRICLRDIAQKLVRIHAADIIHRDIKPGNILINAQGEIRIIDFALAAIHGQWHPSHKEGMALGTPLYMSPEQAFGRHDDLTSACDWYAFGIIIFEWLSGCVPFKGETAKDTMQMHCFAEPPMPLDMNIPDAPDSLPAIVQGMLSKETAPRLQAVRQLASLLKD